MIAAGVGLAVPSNGVSRLLERGAGRAELGVVVRPVQVTVQGKECVGLMIVGIIKSSAAEMASLMLGDILIGVEGRSLDSIEDFERALEGVGERVVRLQFLRGDRATIRTVAARVGLPSTAAA